MRREADDLGYWTHTWNDLDDYQTKTSLIYKDNRIQHMCTKDKGCVLYENAKLPCSLWIWSVVIRHYWCGFWLGAFVLDSSHDEWDRRWKTLIKGCCDSTILFSEDWMLRYSWFAHFGAKLRNILLYSSPTIWLDAQQCFVRGICTTCGVCHDIWICE